MRGLLIALMVLAGGCAQQTEAPSEPEKLRFAQISTDPIVHGERMAHVLGCAGCHGEDFTGQDWSDPELGTLWIANLTQSAAKHSDDELLAMITTGRRPDRALMDMPSHLFTNVHEKDLRAALAYLRTKPVKGEVHPAPTIGPKLAEQIKVGEYLYSDEEIAKEGMDWPRDLGPQVAMGRHIVRATCAECHQTDLRGDDPEKEEPPFSVDLRIVAAYEPADFVHLMRTGKAAGNRELSMMSEVARGRFKYLTDDEVEAVRSYLVELARVDP